MEWVAERRRLLPAAEFVLIVIAFLGPWAYEQIHVPAEFACSPPNIRLEGDFCGTPFSGVQMITYLAQTFRGLPGALVRGEAWALSGGIREVALAAFPLALALPLFTILGRIVWSHSRVWRAINLVAWALGFAAAGAFAVLGWLSDAWTPTQVWGLWLYFLLAMVVLIIEVVSYRMVFGPDL